MFGTNEFKTFSRKQIAALYATVRTAVLATEYGQKFKNEADFDSFVMSFVYETGIRGKRSRLQSAFGQLHTALTETKLLISEETLNWGGFLSGDIVHNTRNADTACIAILNQARAA